VAEDVADRLDRDVAAGKGVRPGFGVSPLAIVRTRNGRTLRRSYQSSSRQRAGSRS
jgi:hypothetical protein